MKWSNAFGWLRSLGDFVFGYDFFVSYAHGDGGNYPRQLADRLQRSGFHVFLGYPLKPGQFVSSTT